MTNQNQSTHKLMVITGGSRGIGAYLVRHFAEMGWHVLFTYARSAAEAELIQQDCAQLSGSATAFRCDIARIDDIQAFANEVLTRYGTPSAIICNAGVTADGFAVNMDPDAWHRVISTNLDGAFFTAQAFLPAVVEAGEGALVFMSSVSGVKGNPGQVNYSASKGGMISMAKSLALETARFGITVNAIAPGYIITDMTDQIPESELKKIKKQIPMRRMGTVQDVAGVTAFLVSESARYITGQVIVVDGGLSV